MDNRLLLNQARKGIAFQIAQSPDLITVDRFPQVSDGMGGTMPDPNGTAETLTYVVRLSHERSGVQSQQEQPSGFDTALSLWLLGSHTLVLNEGENITARGRLFRVGKVDPLVKFDGVQAYQAPLIAAGTVPSGAVTGVVIDGESVIELVVDDTSQLTVTVAPVGAIVRTVTWESDDEAVATVDADGLVTAVGPGSATVTVTTDDGSFMDSVDVEVGT